MVLHSDMLIKGVIADSTVKEYSIKKIFVKPLDSAVKWFCFMNMSYVKKISRKKFLEAYNGYFGGGMSLETAGEHCGISAPTFEKWLEYLFEYNELPPQIFLDED